MGTRLRLEVSHKTLACDLGFREADVELFDLGPAIRTETSLFADQLWTLIQTFQRCFVICPPSFPHCLYVPDDEPLVFSSASFPIVFRLTDPSFMDDLAAIWEPSRSWLASVIECVKTANNLPALRQIGLRTAFEPRMHKLLSSTESTVIADDAAWMSYWRLVFCLIKARCSSMVRFSHGFPGMLAGLLHPQPEAVQDTERVNILGA